MNTGQVVLRIFVLVFACTHLNVVTAFDADSDFSLGVNLYNKQRWDLARDTFAKFLEDYPNHRRSEFARLYLGLSLNAQQEHDTARSTLREFVERNPTSRNTPDALYRIGESSYYLKDYGDAVTTLTKYLNEYPSHSFRGWGQLLLAASHNNRKQPQKAIDVLTDLIKDQSVKGVAPDAYFELGKAYEFQGKNDKAIAAFKNVIQQNAGLLSARAMARLGDMAYAKKNFQQAVEYFDQLVQEFQTSEFAPRALLKSARCERELNNLQVAIRKARQLPQNAAEWLPAQILIARCLRETGQLDQSRQILATAYQAAGESKFAADILFDRAELEVLDQKLNQAVQLYTDLADRFPKADVVPSALFKATDLRIQLGDDAEAQRTWQRLKSDFPERIQQADAMLLQGRLLLIQNKPADAIRILKAADNDKTLQEREQLLCDYLLIKALYNDRQYQSVLQLFQSAEQRLLKDETNDFRQAIELVALCHYRLKNDQQATKWATEFLQRESRPERQATALQVRANSALRQDDLVTVDADLAILTKNFPTAPDTLALLTRAAEQTYENMAFEKSAAYFDQLVTLAKDNELKAKALSGAAWSFYKQGQLNKATERFNQIASTYPKATVADEAVYMLARIQEKSGDMKSALSGYQTLFLTIAERLKTDPDADSRNLGFDAARAAARLAENEQNFQVAADIWSTMRTTFQTPIQQEQILISTAEMQLTAQDYAAAEKSFQELLEKFPASKQAFRAKFVIAEEQMQRQEFNPALQTFQQLANDQNVPANIRENSLFQACGIQTLRENWSDVQTLATSFTDSFPNSAHNSEVRLYLGEALLNQQQLKEADEVLKLLQADVAQSTETWTERIWVTRAEIALAAKRYAEIDDLAEQLFQRNPDSDYLWLLDFVQGRRWKTQAPPDFDRSRRFLSKVVDHPKAKGTESAAKAQFLIAETFLLQDNIKQARLEFLRTYAAFQYDSWRSRALLQSARCDEALGQPQNALRSYEDFLEEFPDNPSTAEVQRKIKELGG